ncbi:hypothetical protein M501DRAFT_944267 [Patellaria atrata CBS 101060]|uniref:RNA binding protein Jsn1 n=1 Tax=Patellaria atrata CBS 101060 TaxID=1346257 RepID=A0A9P4S396_9PEZI|nr:hypothetical protein M501DRAFT_944267 [Patellaria atrata CBS 101060]
MGPSSRPEHHINLNFVPNLTPNQSRSGSSTAATSPIEPPTSNPRSFPMTGGSGLGNTASGSRLGAGSPSHEYGGSRLYSKRAREIQAQEGLGPQVWGPPTSGHSTPLRETIPESPNADSFPDFNQPSSELPTSQTTSRRTRAGTLPSRFSPSGGPPGLAIPASLLTKTALPTPSRSPFNAGSSTPTEIPGFATAASAAAKSKLLSRLRADSMPQHVNFLTANRNPFGPSLFSTNWSTGRDRSSTLMSIQSSNAPTSPAQSSFSKDSLIDAEVKTLDYLGLVDTPQQSRATLAPSDIEMLLEQQRIMAQNPSLAALKNANRFRSYSVNAKEKYAEDDEDDYGAYPGNYSGTLTPSGDNNAAALAIQEAVRQHNLEVQAFANFASASRPRARTAGVLDSPSSRLMRSYLPAPSRLDSSINATDMNLSEEAEYSGLAEAVHNMHLNVKPALETPGEEHIGEGPTRALWLGNIPSSTTVSSLNVIFNPFGPIESTRVLTHKNCGFVNFENTESAMRARNQLNNKEIFPGAGPVKIGYAKVPSATGTPAHNGYFPSPSPDPQSKMQGDAATSGLTGTGNVQGPSESQADIAPPTLSTPNLPDIRGEIFRIVKDLGATDDEQARIASAVDEVIAYNDYRPEIPQIPEPSHNRVHDAPRLREIRKRIDNNSCSQADIEEIAVNMLPEIAELSSDYLGNTVVQKLFEFCSETVKEAMLREISPHMAEIGVHKNGTWAAQKIIDVARAPNLTKMIVDSLRPYSVLLFMDQFGNYVMQGCLRYGAPLNNFIFEVMLSRLWELAQSRFGARAMRACLESHHATKDQQRMIAAAIALHSVQLATNTNGALLLTWFLDTCTFPRRRTVLAPRLVPHLVHLCTHKVAYLTVLKIINQRNESEARDTILQALFFSPNDRVLEDILLDQSCGATLIFKVLTTPFFDEALRPEVVQNVRNVLLRIKAQPAQGYKRLMDEVGLSTRNASSSRDPHSRNLHEDSRPGSKHGSTMNGHIPPQTIDARQQFFPGMPPQAFDLQRTGSMDSNGFEQYPLNALNGGPVFAPNGNMQIPAMTPLQYQQAMMAASAGRSGFFNPHLAGVQGFPATGGIDGFRNVGAGSIGQTVNGSPLIGQQGFVGQQAFGQMGVSPQMYQYPMQYMAGSPQQQQGQAASGQRRGRVS